MNCPHNLRTVTATSEVIDSLGKVTILSSVDSHLVNHYTVDNSDGFGSAYPMDGALHLLDSTIQPL